MRRSPYFPPGLGAWWPPYLRRRIRDLTDDVLRSEAARAEVAWAVADARDAQITVVGDPEQAVRDIAWLTRTGGGQ